jgi:hypothetical protein
MIFLWCLWTINRISEMSHLFLLTTIHSAQTAQFNRHGHNWKASPNGSRLEPIYPMSGASH